MKKTVETKMDSGIGFVATHKTDDVNVVVLHKGDMHVSLTNNQLSELIKFLYNVQVEVFGPKASITGVDYNG